MFSAEAASGGAVTVEDEEVKKRDEDLVTDLRPAKAAAEERLIREMVWRRVRRMGDAEAVDEAGEKLPAVIEGDATGDDFVAASSIAAGS